MVISTQYKRASSIITASIKTEHLTAGGLNDEKSSGTAKVTGLSYVYS